MNKYLKQLVELSEIDKEIDSFAPKIEDISKNLKDTQSKIDKFQKEINTCNETIEAKINYTEKIGTTEENTENSINNLKIISNGKKEQVQNDLHIKQFKERIDELSKKSASVKTAKEANALQIEEDILKEQLEVANEEIEKLDRLLKSKEKIKEELLSNKQKEEENLKDISVDVEARMKELEKQRSLVFDKKSKLVEQINHKVLGFYEKIRKWAKNTAVVPVKKQACYGCFMRIYDKTYLAVIKGSEIVTCPHCGRILYKEIEKENNKEKIAESAN